MNNFLKCLTTKVRFQTSKGMLYLHELVDLDEESLITVEESLTAQVSKTVSSRRSKSVKPKDLETNELRLAIVKEILDERELAAEKSANETTLRRKEGDLLAQLARIEEEERGKMTKEDVLKELEAIRAAKV